MLSFSLIKKIYFLLGDSKNIFYWLILLFLINSSIELLGISLIIPYVSLVFSGELKDFNLDYFDTFLYYDNPTLSLSIFLISVFLLKLILGITINYLILRFSYGLQSSLRIDLMNAYINLDYLDFIKRNSSYYIDSITRMTGVYQGTLLLFLRVISDSFIFIILISYLLSKAWKLVLVMCVVILPFMLIYDLIFKRKLFYYGEKSIKCNESIIDTIKNYSVGLKIVKSLGIQEYFKTTFSHSCKNYSKLQSAYLSIAQMPRFFFEFGTILFVVILVLITDSLGLESSQSFALISLFGVVAIRVKPLISTFSEFISNIRFTQKHIDLLHADFISLMINNSVEKPDQKDKKLEEFFELIFKDISFKFSKSDSFGLSNVDLSIKKGDSVGIVGPSGCGKTTLMDIFLGLIKPDSGRIILNNTELEDVSTSARSLFAYLPQDSFIINGTIKENIALGIKDENIDQSKIDSSVKSVNLDSFIGNLPDGLNTDLVENGSNLSGGQKQRICLARMLYFDKQVIILDEATSALDNENENMIIEQINGLRGYKTLIIIAHRLSTVMDCDKIIKLDSGRILQIGTPKEVLG
jgi:ABC-type bacteriocin/lantibiotic exporter with double-glycine peptidase domain